MSKLYSTDQKYPSFLSSNTDCNKCVNWDMIKKTELMTLYSLPNYPTSVLGTETKLGETIKVSHENFVGG